MKLFHSIIKANKFDRAASVLSVLFLLAATVFLIVSWDAIPAEIAMGASGRTAGRKLLIFETVIGWGLLLLLWGAEQLPSLWNFPVELTQENTGRILRITKTMLNFLKLLLCLLFAVNIISAAAGLSLPVWLIPCILLFLFGSMIFFIVRMFLAR
ncbi:MAG: hypothetical protein Q4C60_09260 [Eubacteriales bacterium]|nr:hypothetical protein [Eubacteriales bacterium]